MEDAFFKKGQKLRIKGKVQSDTIVCMEYNPFNNPSPPFYWYYSLSRAANHFYREDYLMELVEDTQLALIA
jgi:hypothetical protein